LLCKKHLFSNDKEYPYKTAKIEGYPRCTFSSTIARCVLCAIVTIASVYVRGLLASPKQINVTTHSPMVINFLDEDVARNSVTILYKRPDGRTQACRFFEIPFAAQKLNCLAAGDAMLDLSLNDVAIDAEQIRSASHVQ